MLTFSQFTPPNISGTEQQLSFFSDGLTIDWQYGCFVNTERHKHVVKTRTVPDPLVPKEPIGNSSTHLLVHKGSSCHRANVHKRYLRVFLTPLTKRCSTQCFADAVASLDLMAILDSPRTQTSRIDTQIFIHTIVLCFK